MADDPSTAVRQSDAPAHDNVFSEFGSSFWRSGIQKPVQGIGQLVGLNTGPVVQTDDNVSGFMKGANIAGTAAGQLFDMGLLALSGGKVFKMLGLQTKMESQMASTLFINGFTGALYGGVLTPVAEGDSQWSRIGHATTEAGTFMTLGAVSHRMNQALGKGLLASQVADLEADTFKTAALQFGAGVGDRAIVHAGSGAAAGLVNTQLDTMMHGHLVASPDQYINNAVGWALGNVVLGEGVHQVKAGTLLGLRETRKFLGTTGDIEAGDANAGTTRRGGEPPELDLRSLKEIAASGDEARVRKLVDLYYPALKKAFPLPGEIETPETYVKYLMDPEMKWEMEQLLGPIQGGLQYQVLPIEGGTNIKNAGWLEHIWVADHVREGGYGSGLLKHVQGQVAKKGGDVTFWEWNNPDKMSAAELLEDAKGGITTQDRVGYWANRGAYVAVVKSTGEIAPYSQPGMDGQEAVPYLSLAWSKPGGLDGQTILKSDYLKVLTSAHNTITDAATDVTVAEYKAALDALPDTEFQFMKLADYIKQRTELLEQARNNNPEADQRIARWQGDDFTPIPAPRRMFDIGDAPANDEVAKAAQYQAQSSSPWMRTVDASRRFPTLTGEVNADTVVVGSGVVGQQIADTLAGMGQRVIVLERGRLGSGTSSMMGAMNTFVPDTGFEAMAEAYGPQFAEIMQRSIAARSATARLGMQYGDFQPVDSYNIGYSPNHAGIAAEVNLASKFDPSVRFLTGGDAERIFPGARSVGIFPREGNLNPRRLLLGLANSGRYSVFEDSPVVGVSQGKAGDGADVFTPTGVVHANKVIFATNGPVTPFSYLNQHLTPVQTFANVADIKMKLPGNFFDAPDAAVSGEQIPFSYWRQFGLPQFGPTETLVGGTAKFLDTGKAMPFEPQLDAVTQRLFGGAKGRNQSTALIFTSYRDGVPIYAIHPEFPAMSLATGAGGTGLVGGGLLAQAAAMEAGGKVDQLLSPYRFNN